MTITIIFRRKLLDKIYDSFLIVVKNSALTLKFYKCSRLTIAVTRNDNDTKKPTRLFVSKNRIQLCLFFSLFAKTLFVILTNIK